MFGLLKVFRMMNRPDSPDNLPKEVSVYVGRNEVDIRHVGQAAAGFKDIDLLSPENFRTVMEKNGFDTETVYPIGSGSATDMLFVWANEDLLMVSDTNPLNDDPDTDEWPTLHTGGIGHLVGIEGEQEAVEAFYEDLEEQAYEIWDRNPNHREFL